MLITVSGVLSSWDASATNRFCRLNASRIGAMARSAKNALARAMTTSMTAAAIANVVTSLVNTGPLGAHVEERDPFPVGRRLHQERPAVVVQPETRQCPGPGAGGRRGVRIEIRVQLEERRPCGHVPFGVRRHGEGDRAVGPVAGSRRGTEAAGASLIQGFGGCAAGRVLAGC